MKELIENYLTAGDAWKDFIDEKGTDLENATLEGLSVDHINQNDKMVQADVEVDYRILEQYRSAAKNAIFILNNSNEIEEMREIE